MVSSTCQSPSDYRGSQTHAMLKHLTSCSACVRAVTTTSLSFGTKPQASHHAAIIVCHSKPNPASNSMHQCPQRRSKHAGEPCTQNNLRASHHAAMLVTTSSTQTNSNDKLQPCHSAAGIIVGLSTLNGTIFVMETGAVYVSDPFCKFLRGCCANPAVLTAVWLHPLFRARSSALSTFFLRR